MPTSPPPASAFICAMGVDGRASRWPRGMSRQGRGAEERGWVSAPWKRELQGVLWPPTSAEGPLLGAPGAAAGLRGAAALDRTSGIQPRGPRGHGPGPPGDECVSSRPWNRGKTREGRSAGLLRHIPSQRGVGSPPGFCFHAPRAQTHGWFCEHLLSSYCVLDAPSGTVSRRPAVSRERVSEEALFIAKWNAPRGGEAGEGILERGIGVHRGSGVPRGCVLEVQARASIRSQGARWEQGGFRKAGARFPRQRSRPEAGGVCRGVLGGRRQAV